MSLPLSPLELAIVELVASEKWRGFNPEHLRVLRREDTGVGRYVYFEDQKSQDLADGSYAAGTKFVEMEGIRYGLFFEIVVTNSRIDYLELVTCGGDSWDGVERHWRIV